MIRNQSIHLQIKLGYNNTFYISNKIAAISRLPLGRGVTVDTYTVSALILNIEFRPIFATLLE
jgi:hypothetical protein